MIDTLDRMVDAVKANPRKRVVIETVAVLLRSPCNPEAVIGYCPDTSLMAVDPGLAETCFCCEEPATMIIFDGFDYEYVCGNFILPSQILSWTIEPLMGEEE